MDQPTKVRNWYNTFSKNQLHTGVNLRHYHLFNEIVRAGLKKNHKVLEIGCGIGTLTGLLLRYLSKGKLVATDISDVSIEVAKDRLSKFKQVEYVLTDMLDFSYPTAFDFVILPDVLEHIPIEQHLQLFSCINKHIHDQSMIVIHIPHPKAIEYYQKHFPDKLQVIDQAISSDRLLQDVYSQHLILDSYTSYSLFNQEPDYALIKVKRNTAVSFTPVSKQHIILRKLMARLKFMKSTILG